MLEIKDTSEIVIDNFTINNGEKNTIEPKKYISLNKKWVSVESIRKELLELIDSIPAACCDIDTANLYEVIKHLEGE